MIFYCFKCGKNAESKNPKVVKTKNRKIMPLSESAICDNKKWKFINPIQNGSFRGCSQMGERQKIPPFLKSVTHILQS